MNIGVYAGLVRAAAPTSLIVAPVGVALVMRFFGAAWPTTFVAAVVAIAVIWFLAYSPTWTTA